MTDEEFVNCCYEEKESSLETYFEQDSVSLVGLQIAALGLEKDQSAALKTVIDNVLTDTYYTIILALDGCASLGGNQSMYSLRSEEGVELTGELEGLAYEKFHTDNKSKVDT